MIMIYDQFATQVILTHGTDATLCLQHGGVVVHRQAKVCPQAVYEGGLSRLGKMGEIPCLRTCTHALCMVLVILLVILKLMIARLLISLLFVRMHGLFTQQGFALYSVGTPIVRGARFTHRLTGTFGFHLPTKVRYRLLLLAQVTHFPFHDNVPFIAQDAEH
jgi:hypothetical protein